MEKNAKVIKKSPFTKSEERVIESMYQLDRLATAYEISKWSGLSNPTVSSVLLRLKSKKIVQVKVINGKRNWRIVV